MTATLTELPAAGFDDPASKRIEKLNAASLRRIIDPDVDLPGALGDGQVLPDELLSLAGLPQLEQLTPEQRVRLSREEAASVIDVGLRFEAVLMAGFALEIAHAPSLTDPRVVYALHEIGEETRHSRLFSRLLGQLAPTATNPLHFLQPLEKLGISWIIKHPAMLDVLVLGGEEIPDLLQKLAAEHPDTDPFLKEVNRYHRSEEARHLAYARTVMGEHWADAGAVERYAVKRFAPLVIGGMFDMLVHPGVYATVGLPMWSTWKAAKRNPRRIALRHDATRPIVKAMLEAGVLREGRVPIRWRRLAGVDRAGQPVAA